MDIKITLGLRIKALREAKNITQKELALGSDLDRSYIASVESGKRNISIVNIEKISSALQVSVKEFFEDGGFGDVNEM